MFNSVFQRLCEIVLLRRPSANIRRRKPVDAETYVALEIRMLALDAASRAPNSFFRDGS